MADKTQIEWSDATWNVVTGCSRVSAGCENCYAERLAATRLRHIPSRQGLTDRNGRWTGEVRFNEKWLGQPLRWQRPRRIFVAAHGDVFHESMPDAWLDKIFAVMAMCPQHTFQLLTKRPQRMLDYVTRFDTDEAVERVGDAACQITQSPCAVNIIEDATMIALPNVWLGVSAEDQRTAEERIPPLLETPAALRWLSAEPLLGPLEIDHHLAGMDALGVLPRRLPALDWVVVGGESGPGARPMEAAWARSLRNQCICAETAFFFKQWGGRSAKSGGRELDGRTWDEMPPGSIARA